MKAREIEKAFGLRRYVALYHEKYRKYLLWCFGFVLKPGDLVCAVILRKGTKPKKSRSRK